MRLGIGRAGPAAVARRGRGGPAARRWAPRRRRAAARSGASVSLVTWPAQTRSHSAATSVWSSVDADARRTSRRKKKRAAAGQRVERPPRAPGVHGVGVVRRRAAVSGAVSARCSDTQPSSPGSEPCPAHTTSPAALSSSSMAGGVAGDPRRQHQRLQRRRRHRRALQLLDHAQHAVDAAQPAADAAARRAGTRPSASAGDRLDLLAQRGQRAAAQRAQHLGVAPLRPGAAGQELAVDHPAGRRRAARSACVDHGDAEPEPGGATSAGVNGPWVRA